MTVTWYICVSLAAVLPAVVVRQRKPYRRKDGTVLYFEGRFTIGNYLSEHQTGYIQICEPVVDNKV